MSRPLLRHYPMTQAITRRRQATTMPPPDGNSALPTGPGRLPPRLAGGRDIWLLAAITALVVVGWLGAVYLIDSFRFVVFNPRGKTGFEVFLALGQLFGALVLALSSLEPTRPRMRWVATALLVLGLGALGFGYAFPLIDKTPNPNVSMYGSLLARGVASILMAIGLVPKTPPNLSRRLLALILSAGGIVTILVIEVGDLLPALVRATDMESLLSTTAVRGFPGLTGWHLGLNLVPLTASLAALWGVIEAYRRHTLGGWLVIAMMLLAGGNLHSLFWPSMYSSVLTTTSVLRFGMTMVVVAGGIFELRYLSLERAALLAQEQERVRQLEELGALKRDFTSMVAHELASPLTAIDMMAQMISLGALPPSEQQRTAERIRGEARIIRLLMQDIRASAEVEHDDFTVHPRSVPLPELFDDVRAYGEHVQRGHHLVIEPPKEACVLADPARLGQVLRNLLNNAVRHTPEGTRIILRTVHGEGGVRIEVEDNGPGIDPADQARIFEKFGRGRAASGEGRGLGLYLSRRILQAHGTDLSLESEPGQGARFSFALEEAP